jgi:crotonobetainyl-CoA:carnitine CoA-transferase CaiB-like acyl-CoA transferase
VLSVDMVASHPHTLHRRMVVELGDYRGTGSPIKLSRTPATYRTPPPALGVDTDAVLASLGIDPDTRQRLFEAGVLKG